MSIFEAIMMLCFGASWPFQVAKTYRTKNVEGKSVLFLWLVIIGYLAGIIHKIHHNFDWVIYLYILNMFLVSLDTFFYYRYKKPKTHNSLTFKGIT